MACWLKIVAASLVQIIGVAIGGEAMAVEGLVTFKSAFGPVETINRLEAEVRGRGMTVFARVDHGDGAAAAGMTLRPTILLMFGAAKGGTPMMQAAQTAGIDLPLKALVWQDADQSTFLSYNDPEFIAQRHGARDVANLQAMTETLRAIAKQVTTNTAP